LQRVGKSGQARKWRKVAVELAPRDCLLTQMTPFELACRLVLSAVRLALRR